jgi:hypothetical protein
MMREVSLRVAVLTAGIFGIAVGAFSSGCGSPGSKTKEAEQPPTIARPEETEIKNIVGIAWSNYGYSVFTYDANTKRLERIPLSSRSSTDEVIICDVEKGALMWAKQYYKKGEKRHAFELHVHNYQEILDAKQQR